MEGSSLGIQEPQEDISSPSVPSSTRMPVALVGTSSEISLGPCTDIASGTAAPHHRGSYLPPHPEYRLGRPHRDTVYTEPLYSGRGPSSRRAVRATSWQRRNGRDTASHAPPLLPTQQSSASLGASAPPLTAPPPPVSTPLPSLHCPLSLSVWSPGISTAPRNHW